VYPVSPLNAALSTAPPPAYSAVFAIQRQYMPSWYAVRSTMFVHSDVPGANVNVAKSSAVLLLAAITTQATGSRQ
jgi:hypothetical protein